jgi:hypothetical protein
MSNDLPMKHCLLLAKPHIEKTKKSSVGLRITRIQRVDSCEEERVQSPWLCVSLAKVHVFLSSRLIFL